MQHMSRTEAQGLWYQKGMEVDLHTPGVVGPFGLESSRRVVARDASYLATWASSRSKLMLLSLFI